MSRPLWVALLFLVFGAERTHLRADLPVQSDRVVRYTIKARLDPANRDVHGEIDLSWRNTAGKPVDHVYFHLYLNAFRDRHTTYIRESRGRGKAGATFDEGKHPGFVDISELKTAEGVDLLPALAFVAPDDGNEQDRTLARVQLPAAVAPGAELALHYEFTSHMPRVMHRTGWAGDPDNPDDMFFMVAQWFPKIAVLRQTADGALLWNAHQFHKNTEFFSDYGAYEVAITVPKGYVVGATGKRTNTAENEDGTVTVTHVQADVHDFAWTASPHFVVYERKWTFDTFCDQAPGRMGERIRELLARTAAHRGLTPEEVKPQQTVQVKVYRQPDQEGIADRFWQATGASLACYGLWFGQYPYEVVSVIVPPTGGGAAGGMEYPTLFTVWGDRNAPAYVTGMEGVTIHEFGHQFFYGLVGSNEFEEAWLDEGFTSFTDARVYQEAYGPTIARTGYGPHHTAYYRPFSAPGVYGRLRSASRLGEWLGKLPKPWRMRVPGGSPYWDYWRDMPVAHLDKFVSVPQPNGERNSWLNSGTYDAMVMPGWHFASRGDYRVNSYPKPTLVLYALRGLMGEAAFDRAMYAYASTHRFRHPDTQDFKAALRTEAGDDWERVERFFDSMADTASRLDVAIVGVSERTVDDRWEWTIRVQRRGIIPMPIEVRAEDRDGNVELLATWPSSGRETTRTFRVLRDKQLATVRLGPDWLHVIDSDVSNNARTQTPDPLPARTLAARWTFQVEDLLRAYARVDR